MSDDVLKPTPKALKPPTKSYAAIKAMDAGDEATASQMFKLGKKEPYPGGNSVIRRQMRSDRTKGMFRP